MNATTPDEIAYFRLASLKGMLKLEEKGIKSRGGALRPRLAFEFKLKGRDSHAAFIEAIEAKMAKLLAKKEKANAN